ncbi:MAG: hypothetical protein KTR31_34190 [Myxococcales bacterium]|nr:hypothetical protein [Myxococcales bacterium]
MRTGPWILPIGVMVGACAGSDGGATDRQPDDRSTVPVLDSATPRDCVDGELVGELPIMVAGTTVGSANDVAGACGGVRAEDAGYRFVAPFDAGFVFEATSDDFDVVLYAQDGCRGSGLGCVDLTSPGEGSATESLLVPMTAGQELVVQVDGFDHLPIGQPESGTFELTVREAPLTEQVCDDGIDDDLDMLLDCRDPDCASLPLCIEDCTDQLDNDFDGAVDCWDADCAGDAWCVDVCPRSDLTKVPGTLTDSTFGLPDQVTPPKECAESRASDFSLSFTAPEDGVYTFHTVGSDFDTVLLVFDTCGGTVLACNDDAQGLMRNSLVSVDLVADQTVILVVDGYDLSDGTFVLNVQ